MAIEIEQPIELSSEIRTVRREDFGPGRNGDMAYLAVSSGIPCETFIDENRTICGKLPIGTLDIDVKAHLEFFPYCSEEHRRLLAEQIDSEFEAQGGFRRYSVASTNGRGRTDEAM